MLACVKFRQGVTQVYVILFSLYLKYFKIKNKNKLSPVQKKRNL